MKKRSINLLPLYSAQNSFVGNVSVAPIIRFCDQDLQGFFGTFHEIGKYHILLESGQLSGKMRHNIGFQLVQTGSRGSRKSLFESKVFFFVKGRLNWQLRFLQLSGKMRHSKGFRLVRTGSRGSLKSFFE